LEEGAAVVSVVDGFVFFVVLFVLDDAVGDVVELFGDHFGPFLTVEFNVRVGVLFDWESTGGLLEAVGDESDYFLLVVGRN
jgi:hypothetical protein